MGARNPQMDNGAKYPISMAKRKIVSHQARMVREAVAANLRAQIALRYPKVAPNTAYMHVQRATGASLSTLQRIAAGTVGAQLDTLSDIAHHLGTSVQALVSQKPDPSPKAKLRIV